LWEAGAGAVATGADWRVEDELVELVREEPTCWKAGTGICPGYRKKRTKSNQTKEVSIGHEKVLNTGRFPLQTTGTTRESDRKTYHVGELKCRPR
jgi:hypothetical protein